LKIKWSPRLKKEKLLQLYKLNAMQITDRDLLQDVAITLYLRCKAIIAVYDAHFNRKVRCPSCFDNGTEIYLDFPRGLKTHARENYIFDCTKCGCAFTWREFKKSHSRSQLNIGGAGDVFRYYIRQFERNLDDNALMLAVDRLIHEYHSGLKKDGITFESYRIAGANLIEGKNTGEVIKFLDDLSNNTGDDEKLKENAQRWRESAEKSAGGHVLNIPPEE
jgi:hypothetical protein